MYVAFDGHSLLILCKGTVENGWPDNVSAGSLDYPQKRWEAFLLQAPKV